MYIIKTFFIAVLFLSTAASANAATWYDKLPANGDRAPHAGTGSAQPNYAGNINSGTPSDVSPEQAPVSKPIHSGPEVTVASQPVFFGSTAKWLLLVGVLILFGIGWYILNRKEQDR